jgi:adenylyltransferase/sulfurtransferase
MPNIETENTFVDEVKRYARQMILPMMGKAGQAKISNTKVAVIGAGGLGCSLLQYLAAAGFGTIKIIDGDTVSLSNLHRQILYNDTDIDKKKAVVAHQVLSVLNPLIKVEYLEEYLNTNNANIALFDADIIIDGTDNFEARYLINDYCVAYNKLFLSAAVYQNQGQFGVYNFPISKEERSGSYRCLFPLKNFDDMQQNCAVSGVIGAVPAMLGMLMCNETIKIICSQHPIMYNQLLIINFSTLEFTKMQFTKNETMISFAINRKNEFI